MIFYTFFSLLGSIIKALIWGSCIVFSAATVTHALTHALFDLWWGYYIAKEARKQVTILKSFINIVTLPFSEVKLQEKRNRMRVLSVATSTLYSLRSGFHPWQRGVGKTASTVDPISKLLWHRTSQEVKRNCTPLKHRLLLQVPFSKLLTY